MKKNDNIHRIQGILALKLIDHATMVFFTLGEEINFEKIFLTNILKNILTNLSDKYSNKYSNKYSDKYSDTMFPPRISDPVCLCPKKGCHFKKVS